MIVLPDGPGHLPPHPTWSGRSTSDAELPKMLDGAGVEVFFRPYPAAHVQVTNPDGSVSWTAPNPRPGVWWFPEWVQLLADAFWEERRAQPREEHDLRVDPRPSVIHDARFMRTVRACVADPSLVDAMGAARRLGGHEAVCEWAKQFLPTYADAPASEHLGGYRDSGR